MVMESMGNPSRRAAFCGSAAALAVIGLGTSFGAPAVAAPKGSAWSRGLHSRIRLTEAGLADADGLQVAVIEIALDPNFKTYWRSPGDSGIPPTFSFEGSLNARDIKVHFPAPARFEDGAGGVSIGYKTNLVELPVTFRAVAPGKPVRLILRMNYAVCERICVPTAGSAELVIMSPRLVSQRASALVNEHLPRKLPLAAREPLAIEAISGAGKPEHFRVAAALAGKGGADLFVEAAQPWLFDTASAVRESHDKATFTVAAIDKDKSPECRGVDVTLTLVQENRAVETTTWLDVSLLRS
jgi:DsbC/DsbD-like thiol-disulfide interchange protein